MFSRHENNTQRVVALDARAVELGLRPGLGVAEARAMHPDIEIVEADPAADRRLLEALADWSDRYTPLVALDGENGLFLDITGCVHLFGGERALLDDVLARFDQQGFDVRAAIAGTPGAAWAATRYACGAIVKSGAEAGLLASLPLAALRLEPRVCHGLESVGLRVVDAIMHAPRAPLVRRFGKSVTWRLDQALGHIEEAISPRLAMPALIVERHFAESIALLEDIEALVAALSRQLKLDLERRGEGALALQLQLFHADGTVSRIGIAASRPLRDPQLICRLFHEKLPRAVETIDAGYGFDLVRLAVLSVGRFDDAQGTFGEAADSLDADLALFADRVRARLGDDAVTAPHMLESHVPERAAPLLPAATLPTKSASPTATDLAPRPIRLLPSAEQIEVAAAEIPEGPPGRFRWRSVLYSVVNAEGPERIAPEWWRSASAADTRDYFRVEDETGRRYWLYREGLYGEAEQPPRWYMQGMFT